MPAMADNEGFEDLLGDGGIFKKILTVGTGAQCPAEGVKVDVHYVGTLTESGERRPRAGAHCHVVLQPPPRSCGAAWRRRGQLCNGAAADW